MFATRSTSRAAVPRTKRSSIGGVPKGAIDPLLPTESALRTDGIGLRLKAKVTPEADVSLLWAPTWLLSNAPMRRVSRPAAARFAAEGGLVRWANRFTIFAQRAANLPPVGVGSWQ
jgi:hypothetical protein